VGELSGAFANAALRGCCATVFTYNWPAFARANDFFSWPFSESDNNKSRAARIFKGIGAFFLETV
jgi:hypothetical protein